MTTRTYISLGWWGYFSCAVLYVISSLRAGDWLTIAGSLFFLAATVAFLIPHYRTRESGTGEETET